MRGLVTSSCVLIVGAVLLATASRKESYDATTFKTTSREPDNTGAYALLITGGIAFVCGIVWLASTGTQVEIDGKRVGKDERVPRWRLALASGRVTF